MHPPGDDGLEGQKSQGERGASEGMRLGAISRGCELMLVNHYGQPGLPRGSSVVGATSLRGELLVRVPPVPVLVWGPHQTGVESLFHPCWFTGWYSDHPRSTELQKWRAGPRLDPTLDISDTHWSDQDGTKGVEDGGRKWLSKDIGNLSFGPDME